MSDVSRKCYLCQESGPSIAGLTCHEHALCRDCAPLVFTRALQHQDEFPARCCSEANTLNMFHNFDHLFSREFRVNYVLRLEEHHTSPDARVYCSDPACATFLSPRMYETLYDLRRIGHCHRCPRSTCVSCKQEWEGFKHVCKYEEAAPPTERPSWVPEYTPDCRIKACPNCHNYLELKDACNHMTCSWCGYQFCFICLQNWLGQPHNIRSLTFQCPMYGDPDVGYDEGGYEKSVWGIHRDTGLDRHGNNLKAVAELRGGPPVEEQRSPWENRLHATHWATFMPERLQGREAAQNAATPDEEPADEELPDLEPADQEPADFETSLNTLRRERLLNGEDVKVGEPEPAEFEPLLNLLIS